MSNKKDLILNEANLTTFGKLFFAGVASFLGSKSSGNPPKMPIKIKATQEQIKAIGDVIKASKEFQDAINEPNVPIEKIIQKIKAKNDNKNQFERICGQAWPL